MNGRLFGSIFCDTLFRRCFLNIELQIKTEDMLLHLNGVVQYRYRNMRCACCPSYSIELSRYQPLHTHFHPF